MPAHHLRSCLALIPVLVVSMTLISGCNSSSAPSASNEVGQKQGESNGNTPQNANKSQTGIVTVDASGQTLIEGIPVEVFFNDPLTVVSQAGNLTPTSIDPATAQNTDPKPETTTQDPAPVETAETASVDWSKVIPMEILDAEIKSIRNFLTPALQSVGSYNQEFQRIPLQGMTMAALAQIARQHPGDALWKDKAAALRDLSYNLSNAADGPGRKPFDAANLEFENILQIFNGSTPDLAEEPDPEATFADRADRGPLMKRIDLAHRWLTSNTPTASALTDSKEKAMQEAVILGTLVKVSGDESYLYTDEPDYQNHVSEVMAAIEKMRDAIETDNFDGFKEGLSVVSRKCGECHTQYKD